MYMPPIQPDTLSMLQRIADRPDQKITVKAVDAMSEDDQYHISTLCKEGYLVMDDPVQPEQPKNKAFLILGHTYTTYRLSPAGRTLLHTVQYLKQQEIEHQKRIAQLSEEQRKEREAEQRQNRRRQIAGNLLVAAFSVAFTLLHDWLAQLLGLIK